MSAADPAFLKAFDALPFGGYGATFQGKRYRIAKTVMAAGRSQKLEAEELGGNDYISLNLYRLANGATILKPCEMSVSKVVEFVAGVDPD